MHLLPGPANVQMYFVEPHVKRGDYYLMINPITGRRMWVYPRMMAERRYPVVSALGTDEESQEIAAEVASIAQQTQQEAEAVQAQSQAAPVRAPVQGAATIPGAGEANKLFWIGLGSVGALVLAYFFLKKEEAS